MKAIVLLGNMGAGKGSLSRLLAEAGELQPVTVFCMDTYREAFNGDEHRAKEMLLQDMMRCKTNLIYEATAANLIHARLMKLLADRGFIVLKVMLNVGIETAKQRWQPTHLYNPTGKDWQSSFLYIENKLKNEWADLVFNTETVNLETINAIIKQYLHE